MIATDLRHALDPVSFAREALSFYPDAWQVDVLRSPAKRLLLNCCRQSGKSTTSAVLALHQALFYPSSLVLLVSPSLRQSSELFRKVTDHLSNLSERLQLVEDNRLSCALTNASRIVSLPSTEATVRGFSGASLIIEDEASRVSDDLYYAIRPMLGVSGGRLILMSTPHGKRGHFYHEWTEGGATWKRVEIMATECPRLAPEFLAEERERMPESWFLQEYMSRFTETEDQVFGYDLVMSAISADVQPLFVGG